MTCCAATAATTPCPAALVMTAWAAAVAATGSAAGRVRTASTAAAVPTRRPISAPPRATPLRAQFRRHGRISAKLSRRTPANILRQPSRTSANNGFGRTRGAGPPIAESARYWSIPGRGTATRAAETSILLAKCAHRFCRRAPAVPLLAPLVTATHSPHGHLSRHARAAGLRGGRTDHAARLWPARRATAIWRRPNCLLLPIREPGPTAKC
jgi:hypothetical protein